MRKGKRAIGVLAALTVAAGSSAAAQQAAEAPPAREVVERYVDAIGGEAAVRRQSSWRATGTFAVPAAGLEGGIEVYQSNGRTMGRITVPGIGELLRGYDGSVGWSLNPLEGPRLLEGMELAQAKEEALRGSALRDSTVVASLETVGRAEMNGEACWRVKVAWKSGRETHDCYSVASGLLIASTGTAVTPMGEFAYTTLMHDYKAFGDLRIATRVVQQTLGQEQIVTTQTIDFGPVDPAKFALPAAIQALVK
jgi:hypothetical protein